MSATAASGAPDRADFHTILRAGTKVGLLSAGGVVLYIIAARTLHGLLAQGIEALIVLAIGTIAAFLPATWCVARNFEGIAAGAAAGLWGTVVFAICDIAVLRPFKAYPWTWDAIGGGSSWWYLPVWWMLGTFIAWMGGVRTAASAAKSPTLVRAAGPVWVSAIALAAVAESAASLTLPVATGLGFAVSLVAFALVAIVRGR
ncbi:MAG TPA: hypothetical protein VN848_04645 [Gemmatimonadales bacterium]|nr:hypothetical protein [Gemmatimonadales bacterium]